MRNRFIACAQILGISLLLSGCTFWGFKPATNYTSVASDIRCPGIGTQNLSESDRRILVEATLEACRVIHSDDFMDRMAQRSFVERCIDSYPEIAGRELVELLRTDLPDFSIVVRKPFGAEAVAEGKNKRIAIRNRRVDAWDQGPNQQGRLIDTLVHEWTHLILKSDGFSRFQDSAWSDDEADPCYKGNLVSYQTGYIARDSFNTRFE